MNRAAVFVFFDKQGVADAYVDYFLRSLGEVCGRVVVVVNGALTDAAREMFLRHTASADDLIVRGNEGFDAWAYKAGIEHIGREAASSLDELVIANDTVFGPFYPFAEVFGEMERERPELGFWGLTKHAAYEREDLVTRNSPLGYVPAHLQSYFVAFRKAALASDAFWQFWTQLLPIAKYEEAIGKFETLLTQSLENAGFAWDSFVQVAEVATDDPNFTLYCPATLLRDCRMPVLKARVFKQDTLSLNAGEQPRDAYDYVKYETDYDEDMILASLIRKVGQYQIVKSLCLTYILPRDFAMRGRQDAAPTNDSNAAETVGAASYRPPFADVRAALLMHIFYEDMIPEALGLARNMPEGADVYITTDTEAKAVAIRGAFAAGGRAPRDVRLVENRGRSESALLIGMKDVVLSGDYDVCCFWKEKVSRQVDYHASLSWAYKIDENLLGTAAYVQNVLGTFAENPRLGMLAVTLPFHAIYHWVPGNEWAGDYEITEQLARRLGLVTPMEKEDPPVTSFGGAFWFRADAMKKIFAYPWTYADFPEEPLPVDWTLLHAIERVYPFVAQDAGYYPAYTLTDRYAQLEFTSLSDLMKGYVKASLHDGHDFKNHLQAIEYVYDLNARPIRAKAKRVIKRRLPWGLYVVILGAKRVILGPRRGEALREIKFRLTRGRYRKRYE